MEILITLMAFVLFTLATGGSLYLGWLLMGWLIEQFSHRK